MIQHAWWAGETVYTPEQLETIAQALQRPLSETCTRCLHERAYAYRLGNAEQAGKRSPAQEQQRYTNAVTHLLGIETWLDQLENPTEMQSFLDRWREAAPTGGFSPGQSEAILAMCKRFKEDARSLQAMCTSVLAHLPPRRRGPPKKPLLDQPLVLFIRALAFLYEEATQQPATTYRSSARVKPPFERFIAACLVPCACELLSDPLPPCPFQRFVEDDPEKKRENLLSCTPAQPSPLALYQTIRRALRETSQEADSIS